MRSPSSLLASTLILVLASLLPGCFRSSGEGGEFDYCEHQNQCGVGLDCVLVRPSEGGSTSGAAFCTSRCHIRFPCEDGTRLHCVAVEYRGVIVADDSEDQANAFCLQPCEDDEDCPGGLDCRRPIDRPEESLCM